MSLSKKITIVILCAALTGGLIFTVKYAMKSKENAYKNNTKKVEAVNSSEMKDGEYYGEADGYGGPLKVKVTIKNGKIKDIVVVSHNETPEYFERAKTIISKIISGGNVNVDSVSGATVSSDAIKRAVADALSKAGAKIDKKSVASGKAKIVTASSGSGRAGAVRLLSRNIADGTYEGKGYGYGGPIRVSVRVRNGQIVAVTVLSHSETTTGPINYYRKGAAIISRILGTPGKSVNTISGATLTSRGILDAVNDALSKAPGYNPPTPPVTPPVNPHVEIGDDAQLEDGEWYGTATDGENYYIKGPSVVKVKVSKGKIVEVTPVRYTDDDKIYRIKRDELLNRLAGKTLPEVNEMNRQIHSRRGEHYDSVSGATFTARGHMTAVVNALKNSAREYENKKNGKPTDPNKALLIWMAVKSKPSKQYFGEPISLDKTALVLHYSNGEEKEAKFSEFEKYGVKCSLKNGQVFQIDSPEVRQSNYIRVMLTQDDTNTNVPFDLPFAERKIERFATHIKVEYVDGNTTTVKLDKSKFYYDLKPEKEIKKTELFDNDEKLADGVWYAGGNSYNFDIKKPAGDGYYWGFSGYRLTLIGNHNVVVKSFTLDVPKKNYKKGEALDLDNIIITAKMSDGSTKTYSWSGAKAAGFKSNPENKTILNEIGEKTVTIYKNVDGKNIEQTFKIKVSMDKPETPAEDQIPAKVEVYKDGKQVKSIDSLDSKKFENAEGYLLADMKAIKLPESLKNSLNSKIVFKVYNKAGELLDVEAVHAKKFAGHDTVDVKIPGYKSPKYKVGTDYNVGFLKFMVDWEVDKPAEDQIPAKVEVYSDGKHVKSIDNLDSKNFENAEGYLLADMKAIKLPESLKNSLNSKIVFKVYNKAGELLDVEAVHAKKFAGHDTVDVKIPGYKSPKYKVGTDYNVGFLKFMVDWEADATKTTPKKVVAKKAAISDEEQPALNVSETNDASSPKNEGKAELEKSGENSPNNEKLETNAKSKVMDEKPSEAEDKKSDAAEK